MSSAHFLFPAVFMLLACGQQHEVIEEPVPLETEDQKKLYALGQAVARQFVLAGLFEKDEMVFVTRGFEDAIAHHDTLVDFDSLVEPMNAMLTARRTVKNLEWGIEFRKMAAAWPGAVTTNSGLIFQTVEEGTGTSPSVDDTVTAHFNGKFIDGRIFDTSSNKAGPAHFVLNQVMAGWAEAFQMMRAGGKARFVVPPHLAHGEQGKPPTIPPNATLIFEVELIAVK